MIKIIRDLNAGSKSAGPWMAALAECRPDYPAEAPTRWCVVWGQHYGMLCNNTEPWTERPNSDDGGVEWFESQAEAETRFGQFVAKFVWVNAWAAGVPADATRGWMNPDSGAVHAERPEGADMTRVAAVPLSDWPNHIRAVEEYEADLLAELREAG